MCVSRRLQRLVAAVKQERRELRRRNRLSSQRDAEIVALTHLPDVFRRLHEQQLRLPHPHIVGRDRLRRQARRPRLRRCARLLPWPGRFALKRCLDLSSHLLAGNERSIWAKEGVKQKQDNLGDFKPASAYGSLAASTSTFSMAGAVAKSSDAFAISAAATLPER